MFELLGRLKALLTQENTGYLETMLELLTEGSSPVYTQFWQEFNRRKGKAGITTPEAKRAWAALVELLDIVRSYRG
jgi:hypothetical protein